MRQEEKGNSSSVDGLPCAQTHTPTRRSAGDVREIFRLRHLGSRQKAKLLAHQSVLIRSDNGFWRADRCGYTNFDAAAVYSGLEAYAATSHCGPEKAVAYYLLRPADPDASPKDGTTGCSLGPREDQ
jgi:hypothetical protein